MCEVSDHYLQPISLQPSGQGVKSWSSGPGRLSGWLARPESGWRGHFSHVRKFYVFGRDIFLCMCLCFFFISIEWTSAEKCYLWSDSELLHDLQCLVFLKPERVGSWGSLWARASAAGQLCIVSCSLCTLTALRGGATMCIYYTLKNEKRKSKMPVGGWLARRDDDPDQKINFWRPNVYNQSRERDFSISGRHWENRTADPGLHAG